MKQQMRIFGLCLALSACSIQPFSGLGTDTHQYNLIYEPPQENLNAAPTLNKTLLVAPMLVGNFLSGQKIAFHQGAVGDIDYYQLSTWAESPAKQLTSLILEALDHAKVFSVATRMTGTTRGDLLLQTELLDCVHNVDSGEVHLSIRAEIVNTKEHRIAAQKTFDYEVPTKGRSASEAVVGFQKATQTFLGELVAWLQTTAE